MIGPTDLLAFRPAALALNLTPGADLMFCLAKGMRGGPPAALAADAGIALGCMAHVTVAGAGPGPLVAAQPAAFEVSRRLAMACLLWLALRALVQSPGVVALPETAAGRAPGQALPVNLLNPRVILFVLALLPQFTDPGRPLMPRLLILGGVPATGGLIVNCAVGLAAGGTGARLARSPRMARWMSRVTAAILGALALRLALMAKGQTT